MAMRLSFLHPSSLTGHLPQAESSLCHMVPACQYKDQTPRPLVRPNESILRILPIALFQE